LPVASATGRRPTDFIDDEARRADTTRGRNRRQKHFGQKDWGGA